MAVMMVSGVLLPFIVSYSIDWIEQNVIKRSFYS